MRPAYGAFVRSLSRFRGSGAVNNVLENNWRLELAYLLFRNE